MYLDGILLWTHLHLMTNHFVLAHIEHDTAVFRIRRSSTFLWSVRQVSLYCSIPLALGHEVVRLKLVAVHMGQP